MYNAVSALAKVNAAKISQVPAFTTAVTEFEEMLAAITAKENERGNKMAGKIDSRDKTEDELVGAIMQTASGLFAYARRAGLVDMKEQTKLTESALRKLRSAELLAKAGVVRTLAHDNLAALADYGITAAVLANLDAKIAAFKAAVENLGSSVAGRIGANTTLKNLFEQTDDLLKEECDKYIEVIKSTETQFYNEYFAARVIKDLGVRHKGNGDTPAPQPPVVPPVV